MGNLLTAIIHKNVPLTKSLTERDLKLLVISRKISFGNMSKAGAEITAVNTSIVQTIRKQNYNLIPALNELLLGRNIFSLQRK